MSNLATVVALAFVAHVFLACAEPNTEVGKKACESGKLGCWADGVHAQCRFCGCGVYEELPCPNSTGSESLKNALASTGTGGAAAEEKQYYVEAVSQAFIRKSSFESFAQDISTNSSEEADDEKLLDGAAMLGSGLGALLGLLALVATSTASSA